MHEITIICILWLNWCNRGVRIHTVNLCFYAERHKILATQWDSSWDVCSRLVVLSLFSVKQLDAAVTATGTSMCVLYVGRCKSRRHHLTESSWHEWWWWVNDKPGWKPEWMRSEAGFLMISREGPTALLIVMKSGRWRGGGEPHQSVNEMRAESDRERIRFLGLTATRWFAWQNLIGFSRRP